MPSQDHAALDIETGYFKQKVTSRTAASSSTEGHRILIDATGQAASGATYGIDIAVTDENFVGDAVGLRANTAVDVIEQSLGTFSAIEQATGGGACGAYRSTGVLTAGVDGNEIFISNGHAILLGATTIFDGFEVIMGTPGTKDIGATFEYYNGGWVAFFPNDNTAGFQNSGTISWPAGTLTGWDNNYDPDGANSLAGYWIRITRTAAPDPGSPTPTTIETGVETTYSWDKLGKIKVNGGTMVGDLSFTNSGAESASLYFKSALSTSRVYQAHIGGSLIIQPETELYVEDAITRLGGVLKGGGYVATNFGTATASVSNSVLATTEWAMDTAAAQGWGSGGGADLNSSTGDGNLNFTNAVQGAQNDSTVSTEGWWTNMPSWLYPGNGAVLGVIEGVATNITEVSVAQSNITVNLTNTMSQVEICAAIDAIPKWAVSGAALTFQFGAGEYQFTNHVLFSNFNWDFLYIFGATGDGASTNQQVKLVFTNGTGRLLLLGLVGGAPQIENIEIVGKTASAPSQCMKIDRCNGVYVKECTFLGDTGGTGLQINNSSQIYVRDARISNVQWGLQAAISSVYIYNGDDYGTPPAYGTFAAQGSRFTYLNTTGIGGSIWDRYGDASGTHTPWGNITHTSSNGTIALAASPIQTLVATNTITFSWAHTGFEGPFTMHLDAGTNTINWPASFVWPLGEPSGTNIIASWELTTNSIYQAVGGGL